MWLEIKAIMTVMAVVFIFLAVAMSALTILTIVILLMGISFQIMGDVIIGYQITNKEAKPMIDSTPPRKELTILQEIGGKIHFINTDKAEMGIRKFRWHGKEASVINDGIGMFSLPNGNRGFFSHESYDKSISMILCKALEDIAKATEAKDIKEIYEKALIEVAEAKEGGIHIEKQ
jgi:hypothetical protein